MRLFQRVQRGAMAVVATLVVSACDDDSDDNSPTGNEPAIEIAANPAVIPVSQGASGTLEITLTRIGGFTGAVSLTAKDFPFGVTVGFDPPQLVGSTLRATATFTVAASVTSGAYTGSIEASALSMRSAVAVKLTVLPAPPAGNNVTYYFCNVDDVPAFLAYQDGSGAWQEVNGSVNGTTTLYSFNIAQGRGGILAVYQSSSAVVSSARPRRVNRAITSPSRRLRPARAVAVSQPAVGDVFETYLLYGATSELAQDGRDACTQGDPTKTLHGSVLGVTSGQYGVVSLGSSTGIFDGAASTNPFTFHDVPAGPQDLVGSRITTPGQAPDKLILFRNVDVPDGANLPQAIDFNGPASVVPVTATATVSGAASGDHLEIYVDLITQKGSNQLWSDLAPSATSARPWAGFNNANLLSGDMHRIWAFAVRSADPLVFRVATKTVGPVANQTLTLGADLAAPASSMAAGGSYPRFQFQGAIATDYTRGVSIDLFGENDGSNAYYVFASGAYLTASGSPAAYNVAMPDVTALPGFPVDSRLTAGVNVVTVAALGFTGSGLYEGRPTLGAETKEAYRTLTIIVP